MCEEIAALVAAHSFFILGMSVSFLSALVVVDIFLNNRICYILYRCMLSVYLTEVVRKLQGLRYSCFLYASI